MITGKWLVVFALLVLCIGLGATQVLAFTPVYTFNNNFTMLDPTGAVTGGSNDVQFIWDGTLKTAVAESGQVSNANLLSFDQSIGGIGCPFSGFTWKAHDVAVYGPGTYTVKASCAAKAPGCATGTNPITFTVGPDELGVHMLIDWSTVSTNKNIDVVNVWKQGVMFGPSAIWTGACGSNPAGKVWDLMSKDAGTGINGYPMVDGGFVGFRANFNLMGPVANRVVDTVNNNFTMVQPDALNFGGTNDVHFTWDGTKKTAVAASGQVSNAALSSACTFFGQPWWVHDMAIYGPGTYTVFVGCPAGSPGCGDSSLGTYTFTVKPGEIGGHLLVDWNNPVGFNVVNVWRPYSSADIWTGACGSNPPDKIWDWMSYDWDGDGVNGAALVDGPFPGLSANFNLMGVPPVNPCDDNNVCTTETYNPQTGTCVFTPISCDDGNACTADSCDPIIGCIHTPDVVCNDNNACTADTCNPATGCVYTPINCNDNNVCTSDSCSSTSGSCVHATIVCNDNNACTTDTCNPSTGCVYTEINCNDKIDCTTDTCNSATGCMHTLINNSVPSHITQLTNNAYEDYNVRVSNNGDIVWVGVGALSSDIFVFDGKTKVVSQLMNDGVEDNNPEINDNGDIVWQKLNLEEADYNIMLYTKATGEIKRISPPVDPSLPRWDYNPQINNLGQVVFQAQNDGYPTYTSQILLYDGSGVVSVTTNTLFNNENPMINDHGDIVWMQSVGDTGISDIMLRKGSDGSVSKLTNTPSNTNINPRINNNGDIVWSGWDGMYFQIFYYQRATGTTAKRTSTSADNLNPRINASGAWVFTQVSAIDAEIIFCSPAGCQNISNAPTKDDSNPDLNDNGWVTWQEDQGTTGTNDQIFVWNGTTKTRLINNTSDHIHPVINNCNIIAWEGNNGPGTDYDIYMATPGTCGGIDCNDNNACTFDWCGLGTGMCVHEPIVCSDNNLCTIDSCNTVTGCIYAPKCLSTDVCNPVSCDPATGSCIPGPTLPCNDNNICTIDSCNPVTGCVHTPTCNDNNLCTLDTCNPTTGACTYPPKVCDDRNTCTSDSCDLATGQCVYTANWISLDNNFTMLDTVGNPAGGTNDVKFCWDGTKKTSVAASGQVANAMLSSTCQYGGMPWMTHDVVVYGPGTYTVCSGCPAGSPGCGIAPCITFTVKAGEIGIHLLSNWNDNNDIDIVNVLKPNVVFGPFPMWTSGCGSNSNCTVWSWMSYDWDGDGINGGGMVDGPFPGFSYNFNLNKVSVDLCCNCLDNDPCTVSTCDPINGCVKYPKVCNDNNLCTTDTCNTATGCVFTPKNCSDNNLCTTDSCNTATGACVYTAKETDDHNACTTDFCNPITGQIIHTPIFCADGNPCTTDICNTVTGCVYTPKVCNDNNACTTDSCDTTTGACTYTPSVCPNVITTGNNFTMLASNGYSMGGTNDVKFTWDSTYQNATTFANGTGPSNATITSDEPFYGWLWYAKHVQVVGPGTYWVDIDGTGPSTNRYEVTIPNGKFGAHMLFDWGQTGQATSCGKTDCDVDVWMAWDFIQPFAAGKLFTGAEDGTNTNAPAWDEPYPMPFAMDGRQNASAKLWDMVSVDLAGRITTSAGVTVTSLPLDGIPGIKMREGTLSYNSNFNINVMWVDLCFDAATRCNDNNACTRDNCDPTTGACFHSTIVCNDNNNFCTTDTCNPATGCVFTPRNSDDNNACTSDFCSPITGVNFHIPIVCNDNNVCTTDTCSTATGCVFTNNTNACTDNNACTQNDRCSGGVCIAGSTVVCPLGVCNPAAGCAPPAGVSTTGNNLTLLTSNGIVLGGTNDVKFTWDSTVQNATTFANGSGPSNATITSDEPFNGWLWYAKRVQVVGPGTYWVDLDGTGPSTNRYEVTIPANRIGAHMLLDWGDTGQPTSCGKLNCDVDVWIAWDFNNAFMTGKLFTGADDGTTSNGPGYDEPYPLSFVIDGKPNTSTTVWGLVSVDLPGRIITATGGTLKDIPLNVIPGVPIKEGTYDGVSASFNMKLW